MTLFFTIPLEVCGGVKMEEQSFDKHARYFPLQHYVWLPLSMLMLISVFGYTIYQFVKGEFTFGSVLLIGLVILAIIPGMLARIYSVKLQDRMIRTEEQLRYYMLTTKRLDPALTMDQLIALRFAPDEEFIALVDLTLAENLTSVDIKKAIQVWRVDAHRV